MKREKRACEKTRNGNARAFSFLTNLWVAAMAHEHKIYKYVLYYNDIKNITI